MSWAEIVLQETTGSAQLIEATNPHEWDRPYMGSFAFLYDDGKEYDAR